MNRETRDAFLRQESTMNLTLHNIASDDGNECGGEKSMSGSVVSAGKKAKKTLFERVKAFASTEADMDMTSIRFGGKAKKSGSAGTSTAGANAPKKKDAEQAARDL